MTLPSSIRTICGEIDKFKDFLNQRGAEVLEPTNEYELIRFRTAKGTSVLYTRKDGQLTFYGECKTAWTAFKKSTNWRAMPATKRSSNPVIATLRKRDGNLCFFCQKYVDDKDATQEHLVALTHGGPQHISNKYLAHKSCNNAVGYLSATQKIKIHVDKIIEIEINKFRIRESIRRINNNVNRTGNNG